MNIQLDSWEIEANRRLQQPCGSSSNSSIRLPRRIYRLRNNFQRTAVAWEIAGHGDEFGVDGSRVFDVTRWVAGCDGVGCGATGGLLCGAGFAGFSGVWEGEGGAVW
ncbi:hypothetical protein TWF569_009227 [Orbilia oligospora]|uniref:Uncharacterized protein n=1 Tax=Orbilia oligospora TaxID=2813651 RepID=A0A7C8JL82_ORBOL|nr:hypothetical protein TWF103_006775 [Orbilia oligospora]KAF3109236.1 hypothetical protein TWF102_010009 [Orbilia oligospora]KAF3137293.1 hypothetical protein TWF569_009227 [Orbilia oligospora]